MATTVAWPFTLQRNMDGSWKSDQRTSWDTVIIGSFTFPGICKILNLKVNSKVATFTIENTIKLEDYDRLVDIIKFINSTDQPITISNPKLDIHSILSCFIENITGPIKYKTGKAVTRLDCVTERKQVGLISQLDLLPDTSINLKEAGNTSSKDSDNITS